VLVLHSVLKSRSTARDGIKPCPATGQYLVAE